MLVNMTRTMKLMTRFRVSKLWNKNNQERLLKITQIFKRIAFTTFSDLAIKGLVLKFSYTQWHEIARKTKDTRRGFWPLEPRQLIVKTGQK